MKTIIPLFLIIVLVEIFFPFAAYSQSVYELETQLNSLETQLNSLEKELKQLNIEINEGVTLPDKFVDIDYKSLSNDEIIKIVKSNFQKFYNNKATTISTTDKYLIVLPKNGELVLANYIKSKGNNLIFGENGNELKLKRNSFDFYNFKMVLKHLPKKSKNLSEEYLIEIIKIEDAINDISLRIQQIKYEIQQIKHEIEIKKVEEDGLLKELVEKSKFKPYTTVYGKSLDGSVLNLKGSMLMENKLCFFRDWIIIPYITHIDLIKYYFTENQFKNAFSNKYGYSNYHALKNWTIEIGAPAEIIPYIYGSPDKINKSVGSYGVHEQWIFRDRDLYIYVKNDKISSWQY